MLCAALAAAVVARLWIAPLRSSLWLDEFGTWWVTNGRFGDILTRARVFPQSLPYAALVWLTRAVTGGAGEAVLRIPSLVAGFVLLWAIYRLGEELFDRETGLLAAALLVAFPPIVAEARDARPYTLAILTATVAAWMLARWARRGRSGDAAGYAAAATATVYCHYLFAAVLPAHAAWLWLVSRGRRAARVRASQAAAVVAAIAILAFPAALLVLEIGRSAALHSFRDAPQPGYVLAALIPRRVLWPLAACLLVVFVATKFRLRAQRPSEPARGGLALLLLWLLVPIALLAAIAQITSLGVFDARYVMSVVPAQALLLAFGLRRLEPAVARRSALALYLGAVLVGRGLGPEPARENWRGAAEAVRAANHGRPVLLGGTYIESRRVALDRDPASAAYLAAPLSYYDAGGAVTLLPLRADESEPEAYAQEVLGRPELADGFALIERDSRFPSWSSWLASRARARGLAMRPVWDGERVRAWVFEKY